MDAQWNKRLERTGRLLRLDRLRLDQAAARLQRLLAAEAALVAHLDHLRLECEQTISACPDDVGSRQQVSRWSDWSAQRQGEIAARLQAARQDCAAQRQLVQSLRQRTEAWERLAERLAARIAASQRRQEYNAADDAALRSPKPAPTPSAPDGWAGPPGGRRVSAPGDAVVNSASTNRGSSS